MNYLSFYIHGNADGHNEILEMLTSFLALFESATAHDSGGFPSLLVGISSLANIHPLLVHFPIAFLSLFVAVDLIGTVMKKAEWRSFASGLLYLGTVFAGLTVWAGFNAAETVPHGHNVHAIMERHEQLGLSILALSMALLAWRLRRPVDGWGIYNLLSVVLLGLIIFGADLGGLMVYKYGVAVEAVAVSPEDSHHHE
ncbi:MAG: DUF2231 domain-containing protein [Methylococcales bacterium]|nr:DUF2231 domain-containing protein [Methylococcales bacterium]MDD5755285.1 DUF2231 domain-containing protein [Methylococcales bacterium]